MTIWEIEDHFRKLAEEAETEEEFKKRARQFARQLVKQGVVYPPDVTRAGAYSTYYSIKDEPDPGWYLDGFELTTCPIFGFYVEICESIGRGWRTRTIRVARKGVRA